MGSEDATLPEHLIQPRRRKEVPYDLELKPDHALVTPEGARQRGWVGAKGPDAAKVESWVRNVALRNPYRHGGGASRIRLGERYGDVDEKVFNENRCQAGSRGQGDDLQGQRGSI